MANFLVKIGNIELPEPSAYSANTATIVDSGRNVNGVTVGAVIREDVSKVELSWRYLTVEQWSNILRLFSMSQGGRFFNSVTFFDQSMGSYITKTMYVSDRKAGMWRRNPETKEVMGWVDCKLSLVEV